MPDTRWGSGTLAARSIVVAVLALLIGCASKGSSPPRSAGAKRASATAPVIATGALAMGEDSHGDSTQCQSGVVVHAAPTRDQMFICSAACNTVADCGPGWGCLQLAPATAGPAASANTFCVPPLGWVPQATAAVGQ